MTLFPNDPLEGRPCCQICACCDFARDEIASLKSQLAEAHTEIRDLKSYVVKLRGSCEPEQYRGIDEVTGKLAIAEAQLAEANKGYRQMHHECSQMKAQLADMETERDAAMAELSDIRQRLGAHMSSELGGEHGLAAATMRELDHLRAKLAAAEGRAEGYRVEYKMADKAQGKLWEEREDLRAKLAEAERERESAVEQLDELREALYPVSDGDESRVDTITRIVAERDAAIERAEKAEADLNKAGEAMADWIELHHAARQEVARLREALADVAGFDSHVRGDDLCWCRIEDGSLCQTPACIQARAALTTSAADTPGAQGEAEPKPCPACGRLRYPPVVVGEQEPGAQGVCDHCGLPCRGDPCCADCPTCRGKR